MADAWGEHWSVYLAAWFGDVLPEFGDRMDPTVRRLIEHGLRMDAVAFKRLELVRQDAWERLAAVHRDLADPTQAGRSITDIALARGFSSPAHLSRVFVQRYGLAPSA